MNEPTLINDARVLAVPIEECGEPLVDLGDYPLLVAPDHPRVRGGSPDRFRCREGVAERLVRADAWLPGDPRLLIVECHRPIELQALQ